MKADMVEDLKIKYLDRLNASVGTFKKLTSKQNQFL